MTDREIARWVYETCILFGTSAHDAHIVAAIFIDGLNKSTSPVKENAWNLH